MRRRIEWLVLAAWLLLALPLTAAAVAHPSLPSFEEVRAAHRSSDLVVLDRHGEPIAAIRQDFQERRGEWLPLESISPALTRAVLLSEDRRFHEHGGVDWAAVLSAGWNWAWSGSMRGASTITMQLVGMLDTSLRRPGGGRSVEQKLQQMQRARELESTWTKHQILEAYLNIVAFRGELRGVDAAARVMFGKHAFALDQREAAVAAALLRGPNADPGTVAVRACGILVELGAGQQCDNLANFSARWLWSTTAVAADQPSLAPHFARLALAKRAPGSERVVRTTLDASLQRAALQSVKRHLAGLGQSAMTDAAVVVMDNQSGEVLAYVGSTGSDSQSPQVDHARARRQAGSTLKPFLYAQALELRYLTAASLLDDSALDVSTAAGLYIPQNYDRQFAGPVSVRTALASSLNIPAVRVLLLVGLERFASKLRRLGLPLAHDADHYGYSLSLGSADVDLLSLTNAYRSLARLGQWSEPRILADNEATFSHEFRQVFDPMASWIIGDILSDRQARARGFGLEGVLGTRFWTAVKTGTSKDMRDNWTLGWSERHTVGVWVGNSAGASMRDVSGVTGAAPIWHEVMSHLHQSYPSRPPVSPAGLIRRQVEFEGQIEAARTEYFLPGTELALVENAQTSQQETSRIVSPVAGAVLAMDPDMPPANQGLLLRATQTVDSQNLHWYVNGMLVGQGVQAVWYPKAGQHKVELRTETGEVRDVVRFQVRGLPRQAR